MTLHPWSSSIRVLAAIAAIAATLALVACGGDDEGDGGDGGGDEADIEAVLEAAIVEEDPSICQDNVTDEFLEKFYEGDVEACEDDVDSGENADSIEVDDIEVDGDEATADVTIEGGDQDGEELTISLVNEDGEWKIDDFAEAAGEETTETETTETETTETETTETETGGSARDQIETQILAYGLSSGAQGCQYFSSSLIEQLGGQQGCREQTADSNPVLFEVVNVQIAGDSATVTVRSIGGENQQTQTYDMVLEGGEWLISGIQ